MTSPRVQNPHNLIRISFIDRYPAVPALVNLLDGFNVEDAIDVNAV